ncbi:haloacid dehalogenase [Blastocystis sp. subtype 4]|uniref:haloacid dehalogenase n=1 Tax=Blastocystis sp. subtype 4 TaxID=944170 RepID=UPI000711B06E|nr:haloacid dehalogenase [Blastocystis sp. subtype 4]KNB44851.1 haloacid dehalogenase [Blastocystis sp. subtype 4]|eukprot:XP_014528294.1 haloacid dehalogenase [Blastocystis sp. subtype 4]
MDISTLMDGIKVVAFDIDGTLADVDDILNLSDNHVYNMVQTTYPRIRLSSPSQVTERITDDQIRLRRKHVSVGGLRKQLYTELACDAGYSKDVGEVLYTQWQERRNKYTFYPSAVELLHYLHNNGYRVIAITDGTADFTYHPEVQGVVELLINPQNSDCTKSSGTAYSFALQNLKGIAPEECLMVGDNPESDIRNASKNGWKTLWIAPQQYNIKGVKPDGTVSCVGDFLSLLKSRSL